jgi:hypothetical protein
MKKFTVRRFGLPAIVTIAAAAALMGLTGEVSARQSARPAEEAAARDAGEPIMAIISIKSQHVTFYDADGWILKAPVSTGVKGRETPAGVFAVIEKDLDHHSSLYDDASMPHMQRITWNGLAMHGGPLPGYAASHGCVRMPYGFAAELFGKTRIGMRVIISPDDATPVDFSHAALLMPDAEAVAAAPARAETLAREAADAAKAADETKKAAKQAARDEAAAKAAQRKFERLKSGADEDLADAEKAIDKARSGEAKAQEQRLKAAGKAADAGAKVDIGKANTDATVEAAAKPADAAKTERQKSSADADLAAAEKALASAQSNVAKAEERRLKAATKATEAAAKLDTVKADATMKIDAAIKAAEAAKEAATRKTDLAKAAADAKLALEPVSIYISRSTQKLYVRRNTRKPFPDGGEVFDSSIEVPVTIRDPERPIGTHIFTAMAPNGAGLRWTAVSIENGDGAVAALDRISIPKDVLDRIAPTALPRSSIVVSDEPLSRETNYRTEFVAVLSDQPQGGFITRKPTVSPMFKPWETASSGGFFNFWDQPSQYQQPRNARRRGGAYRPKKPWWQ